MSEKLPWFPMNALDFQNSRTVRRMTSAQVGIYVLLLCEEWASGPLPDELSFLATVGKGTEKAIQQILNQCFIKRDEGWINLRLEEVRTEQENTYNQRVRAGRAGAKARYSKGETSDRIATAYDRHSNRIEKKENRIEKKQPRELTREWEPNDKHQTLASELRLEIERQVEDFRDHAAAKGRKLLDWDAAFRMWLRKSKDWERPTGPSFGNEDDRDAQRRVEARARDSKHELETYEADEEKAKEQHDVMREFFEKLPATEQTRLKQEISNRALAIWPNGKPPAAVYRGCFAAVVSEQMEKSA